MQSKNSSPVALGLPPVSTMKGTKLLWSLYFPALMSLYTAAARPGVRSVPFSSRRRVLGHTTPTSTSQVVPSLRTLMSARRWSPRPCGVVTLGSSVAWTPGMRCSAGDRASRMPSWR